MKENNVVATTGIYQEMIEEAGGNYIVRSAENLLWLAMMVNDRSCSFSGKKVVLATDIDLCGYPWIPIGKTPQTAFSGIFDGCGKCISNINVVSDISYAGFFGVIMGIGKMLTAEVYNLRLSGIRIQEKGGRAYVGAIAGYASEGVRIEKCNVGGSMESTYCAGGIIGWAEDCVAIRRCHIRGKVTGGEMVGAIAGKLTENSTLINCGNAATDLYGRPEERFVGYCDETSLVR